MGSKNTRWKFIGSNIENEKTREEKEKARKKDFKIGLALDRMKTEKPKFGSKKKIEEDAEE